MIRSSDTGKNEKNTHKQTFPWIHILHADVSSGYVTNSPRGHRASQDIRFRDCEHEMSSVLEITLNEVPL